MHSSSTSGKQSRYGYLIVAAPLVALLVPLDQRRLVLQDPHSLVGVPFGLRPDGAMLLALQSFWNQSTQYGPELVFTYGPWGWIASDWFSINTHWMAIAISLLIALVLAAGWDQLRIGASGEPLAHTGWWILFVGHISLLFLGWKEAAWMSIAILPMILVLTTDERSARSKALIVVFAAIGGLVALMKFSYFIALTATYIAIAILDLHGKHPPLGSTVYVASVCSWWSLAGQMLNNLPRWIIDCIDLSLGYADAMNRGFLTYSFPVLGLFLLTWLCIFLTLLFASSTRHDPSRRIRQLVCTFWASLMAFLSFKHAAGGNQIEQEIAILIVMLLAVHSLCWSTSMDVSGSKLRVSKVSAALVTLAVATAVIVLSKSNWSIIAAAEGMTHRVQRLIAAPILLVIRTNKDGWKTLLQQIDRAYGLPQELEGTADILFDNPAPLIAHQKLTYRPRPAYLSINAHTERLLARNSAYFVSDDRPDWVFLDFPPERVAYHNRYPNLQDGPSWRSILERYELADFVHSALAAMRVASKPILADEVTSSGGLRWNASLPIPGDAPFVWLEVDVRPNLAGKVLGFLYKLPRVHLRVWDTCGVWRDYDLPPRLGRMGFLISPRITTKEEFVSLSRAWRNGPSQNSEATTIAAIQLRVEEGLETGLFENEVRFVIKRVRPSTWPRFVTQKQRCF